jgi:hypothetical protein
MDSSTIPVIAALAGAAVGGAIAEARSWIQIVRDQRRTLNRVLYAQLDVWQTVLRADPDAALEVLPRIMSKATQIPEPAVRAIYDTMPGFADLIRGLLDEAVPANLEKRYQDAVDQLADVFPVLAYRLSGRPEITSVAKSWSSRINDSLTKMSVTDQDKALAGSLAPRVEREIRADLLKDLEEDINEVAGKLGRRALRDTRQALSKAKARASADREDEIAKILNRVLGELGTSLSPAS